MKQDPWKDQQRTDIGGPGMQLDKERTRTIHNVEVFGIGEFNGDRYEPRDLDDMVSAFGDLDYRPAVKIGHVADKAGAPAWGYVANLRRVGEKLVADLTDIPAQLYSAIKEKRFSRVSAEIYFNLKRAGRVFRRALKAVALLGAEVPAVPGLRPLNEALVGEYATVGVYEGVFTVLAEEEPGREVDRRARELLEGGEAKGYEAALDAVLAADAGLMLAYEAEQSAQARAYSEPGASRAYAEARPNDAGREVDAKAKARLRDGKSRDYAEACDHVLAEDRELAQRYFEEGAR